MEFTSDDHEAGRAQMLQLEKLGVVVMNTIQPTTVSEYEESMAKNIPARAHETLRSLSFRELIPEVIEVMAKNFEKMPPSPGSNGIPE